MTLPGTAGRRSTPIAMQQAAAALVGEHDFASFARPGHGRDNTIRTIHSCTLACHAPKIVIGIEGSGFLWNMVRIIVGTLVQVGMGNYSPDDIPVMLEARDRASAGPTAPPHGLFLHWIQTNPEDELILPEDLLDEPAAVEAGAGSADSAHQAD